MSQIIAFPARNAALEPATTPQRPPLSSHDRDREALGRLARDLDILEPAARQPLAALLAAIDETGEIRSMRRARASAAYQRTVRPAGSASTRLRNPLSASWLPTLSAAS